MRQRLVSLAVVAVVVGSELAGCGDSGPDTATGGEPGGGPGDGDPPPGAFPADLEGRRFVSESVTENGDERPLVEDTQITLEFLEGGFVEAYAGCNHLRGPATADADRLVIGDLPITDMACDPFSLHEQDEWLAGFLLADPTYTVDDQALTLEAEGTVIELVESGEPSTGGDVDPGRDPDEPVASEPALAGTSWRLTTIIDGDTASSVPTDAVATIVFEADSVGFVVEGCNTGGADAEITESGITLTEPLIMTMMLCEGPANDVESAIVTVLDGELDYVIDPAGDGDTLTLTHPRGTSLALSRGE